MPVGGEDLARHRRHGRLALHREHVRARAAPGRVGVRARARAWARARARASVGVKV